MQLLLFLSFIWPCWNCFLSLHLTSATAIVETWVLRESEKKAGPMNLNWSSWWSFVNSLKFFMFALRLFLSFSFVLISSQCSQINPFKLSFNLNGKTWSLSYTNDCQQSINSYYSALMAFFSLPPSHRLPGFKVRCIGLRWTSSLAHSYKHLITTKPRPVKLLVNANRVKICRE